MTRPRYPSDEKRVKTRPHIRVHLTVASHQKTAAVWSDPEQRGMLVELWRLAGVAFAGRTGGRFCLSPADVRSVTGRERHRAGFHRLLTLCSRVGYGCVADGAATFVTIRNFAKRNGWDSADGGVLRGDSADSASLRDPISEIRNPSTEEEEEKTAAPAAAPSTPSSSPRESWSLGLVAAKAYRPTAERWELTAGRRKAVQALLRDHPNEGPAVFARVVHGYRYVHRSWEQMDDHFVPDTLLRASNRAKYLEGYHEAVEQGLSPPFSREASGGRGLTADGILRIVEKNERQQRL